MRNGTQTKTVFSFLWSVRVSTKRDPFFEREDVVLYVLCTATMISLLFLMLLSSRYHPIFHLVLWRLLPWVTPHVIEKAGGG